MRFQELIDAAKQMLALNLQRMKAKAQHDRTALERQIAATDAEVDRLVYELYGLTEAEIAIVEEATK